MKKPLMRNLFLFILPCAFCITACDTDPDPTVQCDFDQKAMLAYYADSLIVPNLEQMRIGAIFLNGVAQAFVNAPSPDMMVEVQVSFGAFVTAYKRASIYGFGPGVVNGMPFRNRFNTYPTDTAGIEANITAGTTAVAAIADDEAGLNAIAYLIFGPIGSNSTQAAALYADPARGQYLLALTQEILDRSTEIRNGWDAYRETFVNTTGVADGSPIALLVNELNLDFETTKNYGFKVPLGKYNGGVVLPAKVELYHSRNSMLAAKAHMVALRDVYNGTGANDGPGLYEYLLCLRAGEDADGLLADAIDERFQAIIDAMEQVPDPLDATIVTNKPVVEAAHDELQQLVPLLKSEMPSALGVRISYQDTDGD